METSFLMHWIWPPRDAQAVTGLLRTIFDSHPNLPYWREVPHEHLAWPMSPNEVFELFDLGQHLVAQSRSELDRYDAGMFLIAIAAEAGHSHARIALAEALALAIQACENWEIGRVKEAWLPELRSRVVDLLAKSGLDVRVDASERPPFIQTAELQQQPPSLKGLDRKRPWLSSRHPTAREIADMWLDAIARLLPLVDDTDMLTLASQPLTALSAVDIHALSCRIFASEGISAPAPWSLAAEFAWFAACQGHRPAMLAVVERLLHEVDRIQPPVRVAEIYALIHGWMNLAATQFRAAPGGRLSPPKRPSSSGIFLDGPFATLIPTSRRPMLARFNRDEPEDDEHDDLGPILDDLLCDDPAESKGTMTTEPVSPPPSMVIVASLDDAPKEVRERLAALNSPLPLVPSRPVEEIEALLSGEFPWMAEAIKIIVADLRMRCILGGSGKAWAKIRRPILLTGGPGCGKSRFARRVGEVLHAEPVPVLVYSAAASSDPRWLRGTAKGYSTTSPGGVVSFLASAKVANPTVVIDELDKAVDSSPNGSLRHALLDCLEQADRWFDECLCAPVNLSQINWLFTANARDHIPAALLSRVRCIDIPRPAPDHFDGILLGFRRDLAAEFGTDARMLPDLGVAETEFLRRKFVSGSSVRALKAMAERLIAKAAERGAPVDAVLN